MPGPETDDSADLALLDREEFFELNPFSYFIVREGGVIVRVNARFTAATGFTSGELAGKQIELSRSPTGSHVLGPSSNS